MSELAVLIIDVILAVGRPLTIQEIVSYLNNSPNRRKVYDYHSVYGAIYREWKKEHYVFYENIDVTPYTFGVNMDYMAQNGEPIVGP